MIKSNQKKNAMNNTNHYYKSGKRKEDRAVILKRVIGFNRLVKEGPKLTFVIYQGPCTKDQSKGLPKVMLLISYYTFRIM